MPPLRAAAEPPPRSGDVAPPTPRSPLPPSRRRAFVLAGLVAAAMSAPPAGGADPPAVRAAAKPALTVTAVQPQPAQWARTITANGNVHAWQEASVGAEAGGLRLAEVRVNVGDRVRRAQVLATFASELLQAELAQGRAAVAEAEAALAEAAANAQRARDLQPQGVLSVQQTNQILTAERTAQARVEAARASLQVLQLRLKQAQVLAPDDGVISARSATVGAVVGSGQELFRLIRQGRLEWRAEVAATELALLRPGQAVRVTPAGGGTVEGRVRMLAPTVDPATRNALVYVDLPQPGAARPGMFARGEFELERANVLTLPQTAVLLREGHSYVFRLEAGNQVVQTKVGLGRRVGDRVEITSGVAPDARVVAQGAGFLADGDLVRVVQAAPAVAPAATAASK